MKNTSSRTRGQSRDSRSQRAPDKNRQKRERQNRLEKRRLQSGPEKERRRRRKSKIMGKEDLTFLKQFIVSFKTTGALCRSSKKAARALIAPLKANFRREQISTEDRGKRILELGPGTGSVTVEILKAMGPHDELLVCEINPDFMNALKARLERLPEFDAHRGRVHFFLGPAQALRTPQVHESSPGRESTDEGHRDVGKFDLVVCCLPFLNLPIEVVREIFATIDEISHEGTILTYFEYAGFRAVGKAFSARLRKIDAWVETEFAARRLRTDLIVENLPPMRVHTLRAGQPISALAEVR